MHNILLKLSEIDDVIFVGGTSEYLQGIKSETNDIDISIDDKEKLRHIHYVFTSFNDSLYGLSGKRGFFREDGVLVDIYINDKKPEYIITKEGYKCETIDSMINLREKTIENKMIHGESLEKIKNNLNRLKKWKQSM